MKKLGFGYPFQFRPCQHKEWVSGGYFQEGNKGWNQFVKDKELTMWDVMLEMLFAARGKVSALASTDAYGYKISYTSGHLLDKAWKEMAQTLIGKLW